MVVNASVLNEIEEAALNIIKNKAGKLQVGSDNTTPSANDTDIVSLVSDVTIDDTDLSVANQVTYSGRIGITIGNGSTIREIVLYDNSESESFIRNLTEEQTKGSDQIFWFTLTAKTRAINGDF